MHRVWNTTKTVLLLGLLFGLILAAGQLLGGTRGLVLALVLGGALNLIGWFFSDTIAIKAMRGQEVDRRSAPGLVGMVERLARRAELPTPRVYICPQDAPNAFATGRNPDHAAVAVTRGALDLLDERELEGVLAHELAHVKNRDTLISSVAAVVAGAISYLGWMFMFGGRNRDVHPGFALLFIVLAPLAAALIQMAISRTREFDADAAGAALVGPRGLASALRKLDAHAKRIPMEGEMPTQNHMFIVQPLNAQETMARLFSTHPPTRDRLERLAAMDSASLDRAA